MFVETTFDTYMLYGENLLEKFNPIHFTIGTDVEFTFCKFRSETT